MINSPSDTGPDEGVNARKRGRPRKTAGRKRRGRSLGAYPFLSAGLRYVDRRKGFLADSTLTEMERKVRQVDRELRELKANGRIRTTNPRKLARGDIQQVLIFLNGKGLDPEYQSKYIRLIERVTTLEGNAIIQRMRDEGERFPTATPKELFSLEEQDLERIQAAAEEMEGWTGQIARFLVHFYPATGLRPSELRLAHVGDIDTRKWTFFVRHPKGENRYARKRTVFIAPPGRMAALEFLSARADHLERKGFPDAKPLIPSIRKGSAGYYSSNWFRVIKKRVEEAAGVEFRLKDFRPTFTQLTLDRNPNLLSDVSKQLGHATTRTTEEHYARIRDRDAFRRLEKAWGGGDIDTSPAPVSNLMR
jgi:integrase